METTLAQRTVVGLVREHAGRVHALERFNIDYCCHGKKSLVDACREGNLDVEAVIRGLNECDLQPSSELDWWTATLDQLTSHIIQTHHAYLRCALPQTDRRMVALATGRGLAYCELGPLAHLFVEVESELASHLANQEEVLFPMIRELEPPEAGTVDEHEPMLRKIHKLTADLEQQHEYVCGLLADMRQISNNFTAPPGACRMYRDLLASLAELAADLHIHFHKENNILFPKVAGLEAAVVL